jgi:hypothetical protein
MTITYRDTLDRDLTPAEVDANFRHALDSTNSTFVQSGTGATSRTVQAKLRETYSVSDFGVAGDGDAFQEALTALSSGNTLIVPPGQWEHGGTLAVPSAVTDVTIEFMGGAWLAPSAGWALKCDQNARLRLINPRVRLNSGSTATRGIWLVGTNRAAIKDPVVWTFINAPANYVGIDVDQASVWCEIQHPITRKDSGGLTGFAKGIRFLAGSNAGRVWGGNFAHCDDGVYIDGSNNVVVIGSSFEDVTDGVEMAQPSAGGSNEGVSVTHCRAESITNLLNISQSTALTIGPAVGFNHMASGTEIANPNSLIVRTWLGATVVRFGVNNGFSIGSGDTGQTRIDSAGTGGNTFRLLDSSNGITGLTVASISGAGAWTNSNSIKSSSATAGIGYGTGAGGTVTQGSGSGKATAVTLSKVTGEITLDAANLNADTTVSFVLTNTVIDATDHVLVDHVSGGTLGAYNFAADPATDSATIYVRNITAGNLAEAIVLRVTVIKAVNA